MYSLLILSFFALCAYFYNDGLKNPHKYKPITFDGDLFPIGAIIDTPNADFHVATAVVDSLLIDDCVDALKALGIKCSRKEVEATIISEDIETVQDFITIYFKKNP
jgi:hypothetical protein